MNTYKIDTELTIKLVSLHARAKKIDYKNPIPKLPKRPTNTTMTGFFKRLSNWIQILQHLERERLVNHDAVYYDANLISNYIQN